YLARRNGLFIVLDASLADRVLRMGRILGDTPEGEYARTFYLRMRYQVQRASEMLRLAIDQYPADESLRQEFLRDHLGEIATGRAGPEIIEVTAPLADTSKALLVAQRHVALSEWKEVIAADSQLAEISWTDAWYQESLELRANWRTRVVEP